MDCPLVVCLYCVFFAAAEMQQVQCVLKSFPALLIQSHLFLFPSRIQHGEVLDCSQSGASWSKRRALPVFLSFSSDSYEFKWTRICQSAVELQFRPQSDNFHVEHLFSIVEGGDG